MEAFISALALTKRPSGANNRFASLYEEMFRTNKEHSFNVNVKTEFLKNMPSLEKYPNVNVHSISLSDTQRAKRVFYSMYYSPRKSFGFPPDVFDQLSFPAVGRRGRKNFILVHDIRRLEYVAHHSAELFRLFYKAQFKMVDCVITVSETMASKLRHFFPELEIVSIYNPMVQMPNTGGEDFDLRDISSDFMDGYAITIGHLERRKNLLTLLRALQILKLRSIQLPLVIVGKDSGIKNELLSEVQRLGLDRQVRFLDGISDASKFKLLKKAKVLIQPSMYEGFGIPLLEGMQVGVPLIASDIPVFHEVCGNCATYFEVTSEESLACSIEVVLSRAPNIYCSDESLRRQLSRFDRSALAKKLSKLYFT